MQYKQILFTKVEAECNSDRKMTLVNVDINIKTVKLENADLVLGFEHIVDYRPSIGHIRFEGKLVVSGTKNELDAIVKKWSKEKKVDKQFAEGFLNIINFNSEVNGVLVAKALALTPPLISRKMELPEK